MVGQFFIIEVHSQIGLCWQPIIAIIYNELEIALKLTGELTNGRVSVAVSYLDGMEWVTYANKKFQFQVDNLEE